jgi:hypothetical protein
MLLHHLLSFLELMLLHHLLSFLELSSGDLVFETNLTGKELYLVVEICFFSSCCLLSLRVRILSGRSPFSGCVLR